jgi:hypothetical protein
MRSNPLIASPQNPAWTLAFSEQWRYRGLLAGKNSANLASKQGRRHWVYFIARSQDTDLLHPVKAQFSQEFSSTDPAPWLGGRYLVPKRQAGITGQLGRQVAELPAGSVVGAKPPGARESSGSPWYRAFDPIEVVYFRWSASRPNENQQPRLIEGNKISGTKEINAFSQLKMSG